MYGIRFSFSTLNVTEINTISICYQHHSIWTILLLMLCGALSTWFSTVHIIPRFIGAHPFVHAFFSFLLFFQEFFYQAFCAPVLWDCMTQMKILHCLEHTQKESGVLSSCFFLATRRFFRICHLFRYAFDVSKLFCWAFVWPMHIHVRTSSTISNLFFPLWERCGPSIYA